MSTIKTTVSVDRFTIILEHGLRDRLYNLLNEHREFIWIKGETQTQIHFTPNAGYTPQDAISIVLSCLYLAQEDNFDNICSKWTTNPDSGYADLQKLAESLNWPISLTWFHKMLIWYVVYLTNTKLRQQVANYTSGLYVNYSHDRWEHGVKSLQTLEGINPTKTFLTREEWVVRIQRVKELTAFLKAEYGKVVSLKAVGDDFQRQMEKVRVYFANGNPPLQVSELAAYYTVYNSASNEIASLIESARKIKYDNSAAIEAVKEITALTPTEK